MGDVGFQDFGWPILIINSLRQWQSRWGVPGENVHFFGPLFLVGSVLTVEKLWRPTVDSRNCWVFFWDGNGSLPKSCWGNSPWTCLSMKVKVEINMNSTFLWTDSNAYASSYWSTEQVIETWARRKECATPGPRVSTFRCCSGNSLIYTHSE